MRRLRRKWQPKIIPMMSRVNELAMTTVTGWKSRLMFEPTPAICPVRVAGSGMPVAGVVAVVGA